MNKGITYLFAISIGIVYLISTMGYGVHECGRSGSRDLVMLFAASSCESVHSSSCRPCRGCMQARLLSNAEKCCSYHGNIISPGMYTQCDGGCCHTMIYVLTDEQALQDPTQVPSLFSEQYSLIINPGLQPLLPPELVRRSASISADHPLLIKDSGDALAGLSCWRL